LNSFKVTVHHDVTLARTMPFPFRVR
jgi:hypothetical protein